jgi:hypothetical protein
MKVNRPYETVNEVNLTGCDLALGRREMLVSEGDCRRELIGELEAK